jgi:hypothetical protein
MAGQNDAGAEKKGFFARRKERKEADKAPLPAPKVPAAPLKPGASPARPAGAPPKTAPPASPAPRVSLESLPEVEKRIDRMAANERRQKLLERYEQKYGEKLDLPNVFVSIEDEKKAEAAAAADAMAGGKAIDEGKMAAVTGMAPPKPAAPPPKPAAPAKTGFFGTKPAPPPAAKPGALAPPRPAAPVATGPAAPAAAPKPVQPKKPSPVNGKSFWKYLWPYWRLPMRGYAKYYWPDKGGIQAAFTVIDIPIWIILAIPRIGLCPVGYLLDQRKKKAAAMAEAEVAAAAD